MGRPTHWWYTDIKRAILYYKKYKNKPQPEYRRLCEAIDRANEEVAKMKNAEERQKAINDVLFAQTKTVDGVALDLNYSRYTIQSWIADYINLVGEFKGYETRKKRKEREE